MDYFRDYPENFLVLDIAKGDGWDKLCPFLGVDVPDLKFPHAKTPTIGPLRMVSKKDRLAKGAMIENLKRLLA